MSAGPSYFHGGSAPPLLDTCVGEVLDETARAHPGRAAVISRHEGLCVSYARLRDDAEVFARGLLRMGVNKGDRVALWASNCVQWVVVQYAAAKIGAVLVTLNPSYAAGELELILRRAECQTLIMTPRFRGSDHIDALAAVCPEVLSAGPGALSSAALPLLRNVVLLGPGRHEAMYSWSEVAEMGEDLGADRLTERERSLSFGDPVSIQFTSGTTGSPKGVVLSHYNIVNNARLAGRSMSLGAEDRICLPVPFFHCFGMVLGSVAAVLNGATMVLPGESFDAAATLEAIAEERCTAVYGVPTMFIRELEHPRFGELDLGSLRTGNIGGAPCPPALVKRIIEEMHCPEITIGYGLTEASPLITQTTMRDPETSRLATVGRGLPHTEVKIVDVRTKEIVDRGLEGELCVRGYGVMGGYYKDEAATRSILDEDGWLHTGDVATMDEDGYFRIVGRIKDVIIRGGEKIHPREVEDLLITHSAISEAHVVGVPDAEYGERVAAWVKPEPGCSLSPEDVVQFCRGKVAAFKVPGIVRIVSEFPTTLTGKIQKFRIREMAARELAEGEMPAARTV